MPSVCRQAYARASVLKSLQYCVCIGLRCNTRCITHAPQVTQVTGITCTRGSLGQTLAHTLHPTKCGRGLPTAAEALLEGDS